MSKTLKNTALAYAPETVGLYHATHPELLYKMLKSKKILLSTQALTRTGNANDVGMGKYGFYLSLSRERFGGFAFARNMPITIVLDQAKLKANFKIVPYDYWGRTWKDASREARQRDPDSLRRNTESEDRLIANTSGILFDKYVKSIHALVSLKHTHASSLHVMKIIQERFPETVIHCYEDPQRFRVLDVTSSKLLSDIVVPEPSEEPSDYDPEEDRISKPDELITFCKQSLAVLDNKRQELPDMVSKYWIESDLYETLQSGFHNYSSKHDSPLLDSFAEHLSRKMARLKLRSFRELITHMKSVIADRSKPDPEELVTNEVKSWLRNEQATSSNQKISTDDGEYYGFLSPDYLVFIQYSGSKAQVYRFSLPSDVWAEHDWVDVAQLASNTDESVDALREMGEGNVEGRYTAMYLIAKYEGIENLDSYPLKMSTAEAFARYCQPDVIWDEIVAYSQNPNGLRDLADYLKDTDIGFRNSVIGALEKYNYKYSDFRKSVAEANAGAHMSIHELSKALAAQGVSHRIVLASSDAASAVGPDGKRITTKVFADYVRKLLALQFGEVPPNSVSVVGGEIDLKNDTVDITFEVPGFNDLYFSITFRGQGHPQSPLIVTVIHSDDYSIEKKIRIPVPEHWPHVAEFLALNANSKKFIQAHVNWARKTVDALEESGALDKRRYKQE